MPLTSKIIEKAVRRYNRTEILQDKALQTALNGTSDVLVKVCLVADWGSLGDFSFRDRILTARTIQTDEIAKILAIARDTVTGIDQVEYFIQTHLISRHEILKPRGAKGRQLSFISKYLHWCVSSAFPIWDSYARLALEVGRDDPSWGTYKLWIPKIVETVTNHTQIFTTTRANGESMVRTLDKALWIIGKSISKSTRKKKANA